MPGSSLQGANINHGKQSMAGKEYDSVSLLDSLLSSEAASDVGSYRLSNHDWPSHSGSPQKTHQDIESEHEFQTWMDSVFSEKMQGNEVQSSRKIQKIRWDRNYSKQESKNVRDFFDSLLQSRGIPVSEKWRNEAIQGITTQQRDQIAHRELVTTPLESIKWPLLRKPKWTEGLESDLLEQVHAFGDRVMSKRAGKSDSNRNKILSTLTPDELKAIGEKNKVEIKRIEETKLPKPAGKKRKNQKPDLIHTSV